MAEIYVLIVTKAIKPFRYNSPWVESIIRSIAASFCQGKSVVIQQKLIDHGEGAIIQFKPMVELNDVQSKKFIQLITVFFCELLIDESEVQVEIL